MNKKPISPVCWVPTVYFAMGLPFVALSMVSVLMFSDMEVSNAQIAFWTSLIMLPWTLKPLWSPFLEMFKTKKVGQRQRKCYQCKCQSGNDFRSDNKVFFRFKHFQKRTP